MTPTSDATVVITTKVRLGVLRHDKPDGTWGGRGSGGTCDGCERAVTTSEPEIEADFDLGATALHFHVPCFLAWLHASDAERMIAI